MTTMAKRRGEPSYWEQRYAEWWDRPFHGMSTATEEFMAREEENVRDKLAGLLEQHHRVLDAGCGYGRITPYIAPLVAEYVGVDFSHQAIETAAEEASGMYVACDILDFHDGPFDVVVMVGIESSLHYRPEIIEHLRTLLAPEGVIAVFEYNDDRLIDAEGNVTPL